MTKYDDNLFNSVIKAATLETDNLYQKRINKLTVDLSKISSTIIDTGAIFIKGDIDTSFINANVVINGDIFNLTGYTVTVNIKENNKIIETFICTDVDAINGIIYISLPSMYTDDAGQNIFELVFQKGSEVITSQQYSYKILASLGEGEYGTDNELTALQQLIQQVQTQEININKLTEDLIVSSSDIDDVINMI